MRRAAHFGTLLGLILVISLCLGAAATPAKQRSHTKAERWVRHELESEHLAPTTINCRARGPASVCRWGATKTIQDWTFHCGGQAERTSHGSEVDKCRLKAPDLAPVLPPERVGTTAPLFGLNEDWTTQIGFLDLASGLGANTSRVPFHWDQIEPQRNSYDWSAYDGVYNAMTYRGIKPMLALDGAPCWARPDTPCVANSHYPPGKRFYRDWREWVELALRRYPNLAGVEVWNEPNLTGFWQPKPNPRAYTKLLRVTSNAVRAANPSLPVVFGGLVPQFGPATRGMDSRIFQRRAYKAGAARYVDAFAVHPYVFPSSDPNLIVSVLAQMAIPKGIAARFGHPRTPLWVTEFGLSTVGEGALSTSDQAAKLVALYQLLRSIPGVPVVILHRLIDLSPEDHDWQAGMGLASPTGTPKPSYCALARARTGFCPY